MSINVTIPFLFIGKDANSIKLFSIAVVKLMITSCAHLLCYPLQDHKLNGVGFIILAWLNLEFCSESVSWVSQWLQLREINVIMNHG